MGVGARESASHPRDTKKLPPRVHLDWWSTKVAYSFAMHGRADALVTDRRFYRPRGAPLSPRTQRWAGLVESWVLLGGVAAGAGVAALVIWAFGRLV